MQNIIHIYSSDSSDIHISRTEILRYLQYRSGNDTSGADSLIDECISEFQSAAEYKACYIKTPIHFSGDDTIDFGFMRVKSRSLGINMKNCSEAYVFAATVGIKAERLLTKYARISPSRAFIHDSVGSAAIEAFCDTLNGALRLDTENSGRFLRPRFSPGYGDFPLAHQSELLRALDTPRKINLVLTDSLMMVPSKSVTAVIGIADTPNKCRTKNCESCSQEDCLYRK